MSSIAPIPHQQVIKTITATIIGIFTISAILNAFLNLNIDADVFFFTALLITGIYKALESKFWLKYLNRDEKNELIKPWWLAWTAELFYVTLFVFVIRSFLFSPIMIPSGSMLPTIGIGDYGVVSKFSYDVKVPLTNYVLYKNSEIKRSEVIVFKYPKNPSILYIKRVVGLPNDTIKYVYDTKTILINNKEIKREYLGVYDENLSIDDYMEDTLGVKHHVLIDNTAKDIPIPNEVEFTGKNNCTYTYEYVSCKIPKNKYFALGDNRDHSLDSRYWGFVPRENVVGRAEYVYSMSDKKIKKLKL